jgi:hypothetical protein
VANAPLHPRGNSEAKTKRNRKMTNSKGAQKRETAFVRLNVVLTPAPVVCQGNAAARTG